MKNFDLNACGVQEMNEKELLSTVGGVGYFSYTWSGTGNSLVFAFEAASNGCKLVANGGIWVYNQF